MRRSTPWFWVATAAVIVGLGAAGLYEWHRRQSEPPPTVVARQEVPPAPAPRASAPPAILHPLRDEAASAPGLPSDPRQSDAYVKDALIELLGRANVLSYLNTDNFVFRVVATVDNLPRAQAPSRQWPLVPTPGRFTADKRGDELTLSATNAKRYARVVGFIESVDMSSAAALYLRLYPLLQRAYEQMGYPGRYFNDRVVEAIDQLIETPEPQGPVKLKLVEVNGPIASTKPWLHYEFDDPALESRSAGQKILLRMGVDNERRLKTKLSEFREEIAHAGAKQ
jgi:hypothetical protein